MKLNKQFIYQDGLVIILLITCSIILSNLLLVQDLLVQDLLEECIHNKEVMDSIEIIKEVHNVK